MDDTVKLTSINVVLGIVAGLLSGIFTIGTLGFKNDMVGLIFGIVFIYAMMKSADKIATEEIDRSQKIWDCVLPFFFTWIIVWILIANYW
ncbi:DUF5379 family protein [Methanobrevibacter millerae]|uniref:Uncharacterized protein n=1 Tax=Methanobrevibacter millerae TaxID=230361 RepID=A0A0U3DSX2_9EURY|nr:DUF5379 family protein [Methanobrevibacter millerae]ALT69465.1 hypothetical protein sm9_1698 [Methanobrevibacter millerae]MBO6111406.1 DUF5379 family protein [Methanobrevibacter sp.]